MPKSEAKKRWERKNPDKVNGYKEKFLSNRKQVNIILEQKTLEAIDKRKPSDISYSTWIRKLVEEWADCEQV